MKLLVLADIHSSIGMLEAIKKRLIHNIDLVLLLGDNTQFGGRKDMEKVLETIGKEKILALAGNLDTKEALEILEEKNFSLHAKKKTLGKFVFVGFGGGLLRHPGDINFSEEEIYNELKKLCSGEKNIVLCTHLPPFGTKIDLAGSGVHIGSKAVRKIIEEFSPVLNLCGHCHEAVGEERIGSSTECINCGAVKEGHALLLELNEKISWKRAKV